MLQSMLSYLATVVVSCVLLLCLLQGDIEVQWQYVLNKVENDLLYIKDVQIHGIESIQARDLLEQIGVNIPIRWLDVDVLDIKRKLEKNVKVQSATVKLIMPSLISIDITERTPVAVWLYNDKFYLVDNQGITLEEINDLSSYKQYIIITGKEANMLFSMILTELKEQGFHNIVYSLQLVGGRRWNLLLHSGIIIKLPENNLSIALQALKILLTIYARNPPEMIDLRIIPDRIYIKF